MEMATQYSAEQTDIMVDGAVAGWALAILGAVRLGRLRWTWPRLPEMDFDWRGLWRELRPRKFRWGWALLLATALVLVIGEFAPAASVIWSWP